MPAYKSLFTSTRAFALEPQSDIVVQYDLATRLGFAVFGIALFFAGPIGWVYYAILLRQSQRLGRPVVAKLRLSRGRIACSLTAAREKALEPVKNISETLGIPMRVELD